VNKLWFKCNKKKPRQTS